MGHTLRKALHLSSDQERCWEILGVSLICFPRVQPSHLHMGGEARGSTCSLNQLSLRCDWRLIFAFLFDTETTNISLSDFYIYY